MLAIRPATQADIPLILGLIRDLAEYEREPQAAVVTEAALLRDGFPDSGSPKFHVLIAEWDSAPAAFALYFFNYSTWQGRPGLYLEDLFVKPPFRGKGIGRALFIDLARIAVANNCGRFQWQVLDWNQPAIDFYKTFGARTLKEWLTMRVEDDALLDMSKM